MSTSSGRSAQPAPRASTLDVLMDSATSAASAVYRKTGQTLRAVGYAVDADTFTRAAAIARDRFKLHETNAEIEERGWFDFDHPDGFKMRIAVDDGEKG